MKSCITGLGLLALLFSNSVYCRRGDNDDENVEYDYTNTGDDEGEAAGGMNGGRPGGTNDRRPGGMNGGRPGAMGGMFGGRSGGMNGGMPGGMPGGMAGMFGMFGGRPGGMGGMSGGGSGGMGGMRGKRPGGMEGMNGGMTGGMAGMSGLMSGMRGMNGGRPGGMGGMAGGGSGGMGGMAGGGSGGMGGMRGKRPGGMGGMSDGGSGGMGGMRGKRPGGMEGMNGGMPGGMAGMLGLMSGMRGMNGGRPGGMGGMAGGRPGGMGGMAGGRPGGMGGMAGGRPGGMGGMAGGRPGGMGGMAGGRPGGMGGMAGGRPGGMGGMAGGRPGGMGGRNPGGNRGNGGDGNTMSREEREALKAKRRERQRKRKQVRDERKRKQDQNKITYVVKGMTNFSSGDYAKDSTLMKLYMSEYEKVVSILGKRRDILMNKLRAANLGGQARTSIVFGSFKRTNKVSSKWNGKCLNKFADLVEEYGENPTGKDLKKAKALLERVTGNYIKEVKKQFDDLSKKVDERDKGYFIDNIQQDTGNEQKNQALVMDLRKIGASLGCAIQEKKVDLEPYHCRKYQPTATERHLMKRLGTVRMNAMANLMDFQKEIMADILHKDKTLPVDIEMARNGLKNLEEKRDELLEKAIEEMGQIVEEEQVDPEHLPLKEKLSEIAQDFFKKEKASRRKELKAIMDDTIGQVADRKTAGMIEGLLRRRSMTEIADIQKKIGAFVNKVVTRYAKAGGSLEQKVARATPSLKTHILKVMDKGMHNLKQFGAKRLKALKQG